MSQPPGRRTGLFSDGIPHAIRVRNFRDHCPTPAPPHFLLAGAALLMI
jgi:hypothetical protein